MKWPEGYRVVKTKYGNGESEETIPLGRWKKNGGLAGKRGHVYVKSDTHAGVWLISGRIHKLTAELIATIPSIEVMQCGDGEATLSIPWGDLPKLLPMIGAKKLRVASPATLDALARGRATMNLTKNDCAEAIKTRISNESTIVRANGQSD